MKKIGLVAVVLMFVLSSFTVQSAEKQFKLVFEYHGPATHNRAGNTAPMCGGFMDTVEKKSGGRIKFERHWGGQPVPVLEMLSAVKRGTLDIISETPDYYSGQVAIGDIGIMPKTFRTNEDIFDLWWNSPLGKIIDEAYQKRAGVKVLFPHIFGDSTIQVAKATKKIRRFEDFNGLKMRAPGGIPQIVTKALGAAPVSIVGAEYYTAMQRGVVDAGIMPTYSLESYKLWEVADQVVNPPIFSSCFMLWFINMDKWKELGPELQQLIISTHRETEKPSISYIVDDDARVEKIAREKGVQFYTLPSVDQEKLLKAMENVWDDYIAKCEKQGMKSEATQVKAILHERFNSKK